MSKPECELNNQALDMITEADHLNNYCLCSKCTCGKHICPKPKPKRYPKSIFNSYYKMNYKRHSVPKRQNHSAIPQKKSLFRLSSETTQSIDYKAYPIDPPVNQKPSTSEAEASKVEKSKYRLSASSIYKQDFAN